VLWINTGEEQVEPSIVERAVGIGEVPIRLRQVVPIQLTEVLQDSSLRTVDTDELNWLGWRAERKS